MPMDCCCCGPGGKDIRLFYFEFDAPLGTEIIDLTLPDPGPHGFILTDIVCKVTAGSGLIWWLELDEGNGFERKLEMGNGTHRSYVSGVPIPAGADIRLHRDPVTQPGSYYLVFQGYVY